MSAQSHPSGTASPAPDAARAYRPRADLVLIGLGILTLCAMAMLVYIAMDAKTDPFTARQGFWRRHATWAMASPWNCARIGLALAPVGFGLYLAGRGLRGMR